MTRSVLIISPGDGLPVVKGDANPNVLMECGGCGRTLIRGLQVGQLEDLVFKCPDCGAYNETIEG